MEVPLFLVLVVVIVALLFDFTNGFHDAANAIATVVATKVMTIRQALSSCRRGAGIQAMLANLGVAVVLPVSKTCGILAWGASRFGK